jgi:cytochrome c oxidase subunit IV
MRVDERTSSRSGTEAHLLTFALLLTLTALELAVIRLDVERAARITALAGLAITKAGLVLWIFMRLKEEPRALRATALLPFLVAPGFAVVLMLEAAFRARLR